MPNILFIQSDGTRVEAVGHTGDSVMRAAIENGVRGILAECGGNAICGTCHVYADDADLARLPPPGANELELLGFTAAPRLPGSRLSCQIKVGPGLEGAVFRVPDRQD